MVNKTDGKPSVFVMYAFILIALQANKGYNWIINKFEHRIRLWDCLAITTEKT